MSADKNRLGLEDKVFTEKKLHLQWLHCKYTILVV